MLLSLSNIGFGLKENYEELSLFFLDQLKMNCNDSFPQVVDLVFLRLKDWQDLLLGYPDVKRKLYASASQFKKNI